MEQKKSKPKTLKDMKITFYPYSNEIFSSLLGDEQGNYNLFRLILDKNAPEITQRIYANDDRINY